VKEDLISGLSSALMTSSTSSEKEDGEEQPVSKVSKL
jgi:hypothetical protein